MPTIEFLATIEMQKRRIEELEAALEAIVLWAEASTCEICGEKIW